MFAPSSTSKLISTFNRSPKSRYLIAHTIDKTLDEGAGNERMQIFKSIDFNFVSWMILTILFYLSISTMFVYLHGARKNLKRIFRSLMNPSSQNPIDQSIMFGLTVFFFIASLMVVNCIKTTKGEKSSRMQFFLINLRLHLVTTFGDFKSWSMSMI